VELRELPTPALVVDAAALDANLALMANRLPGAALRPHVKAHKCTALAARQHAYGHLGFTCATPREVSVMAGAGLGADLLLANEVLDEARLRSMIDTARQHDARVTVAVDSPATIAAAASGGVREVVIDIDVGLPRCGVVPDAAGDLATRAAEAGLVVRGVMGYEGHLQMDLDPSRRAERVREAMIALRAAHRDVGGDIVSAGGTGTHRDLVIGLDDPAGVTEVQAGSYALMDTDYMRHDAGFVPAINLIGTVISVGARHGVIDVGLKALGMDHGPPTIDGAAVWFCSDEHITFAPDDGSLPRLGDRIRVRPAHLDPTVARHQVMWLVDGDAVIEPWPIDMRHW
jgi:D-serine deaminase-like pyridoxal phosphate-dependent protein